ncbi:unnamed protein product [Strongylus vulgaris]|uniref:Uncharacterized protein n=1 Tax=Strongylus vulgaris TaxID=40348 RepID=A0A3P7L1C1_STRVU|nr:unnamed protein product [Strongylus vulgaris]
MLRIDAEVFMVNLLDMEVSDEVVEKTAELEKRQQNIKNERVCSKQILDDSVRSFTPIVININEDAETSFIE